MPLLRSLDHVDGDSINMALLCGAFRLCRSAHRRLKRSTKFLEITECNPYISRIMAGFIPRPQRIRDVHDAIDRSPLVALLGPRQCGKTTLAHEVAGTNATYFDLERGSDRQALAVAAERTLGPLRGTVVLDEVQTMPELFPTLRVLADRPLAKFLLLGSASPDLIRGASETLAGRVAFVYLNGFDLAEVGSTHTQQLWQRGGFPRSFLAASDTASHAWREDFIETFLSRDAAGLGS